MQIIKMFGPSISDPSRIVNRDVPACDEQAYRAAGYKRGSVSEEPEAVEAPKAQVKNLSLGSEELPMEEPDPVVEPELVAEVPAEQPIAKQPARPRRKRGQS